jgi:ABC-type multidrug transport system permease subunit
MFTIAFKDIKLFFSDRRGLLMAFAVPIALITLFAFAFGGASGGESKPEPRTLVMADNDHSGLSETLITQIDSLEEFEVLTTTADTAEMFVAKGDYAAVVVIEKGFSDSIAKKSSPVFDIRYDEAQGPEVAILMGALFGKLNEFVGEMKYPFVPVRGTFHGELDPAALDSLLAAQGHDGTPVQPKPNIELRQTAVLKQAVHSPGLVHAVAGTAIMMLLFSVTAMGMAMLDEKQEGTLKKLIMSPISPTAILFGKMISVNIISMLQLAVMFVFGWLAFGLDIVHHIPSLVIMIFCTAFACSSFGVFLISFAKSRNQVQGMSTLVIMTMSALGGSMVPSFIMPAFMQKLGVITVNYWGVQGFYDIFWRDLAVTDPVFLTKAGVLIIIGTVLSFIATRLFKRNVLSLA